MKEKLSDWFSEHKAPILIALAVVVVLAIVVTVVLVTVKNKGETADSTVPAAAQTATGVLTTQEPTTLAPATVPTTKAPTTAAKTTAAQNVPEEAMVIKDSNKTVYYPKSLSSSERKYPVIVWANGTGCATSTYDSLLKIFAEAGYIVVADDSVMTADGTEQRDSIDYILDEAKRSGSKFYQKVDTSKIGAVGHSQGGRSAVNAAQKDSRIVCVLSIAGASNAEEAGGLSTPIFFMTGTNDMVVASSMWVEPSYNAVTGKAVYASLKNGVHTTCMTNPTKISGYAVDWFDAYLKGDSSAKKEFAAGAALSKDSAWQDFACKN